MEKSALEKRDHSLGAFRAISIITVIATHATNSGWAWYGKEAGAWDYYFTMTADRIYAFCVPSLFFISGYFVAQKAILEPNNYSHNINNINKPIYDLCFKKIYGKSISYKY